MPPYARQDFRNLRSPRAKLYAVANRSGTDRLYTSDSDGYTVEIGNNRQHQTEGLHFILGRRGHICQSKPKRQDNSY